MHTFFRLLVVAIPLAALTAVGCASTPDPPPPDLTAEKESTEARIQSLNFAERAILEDLNKLEELEADLEHVVEQSTVHDVPLSLLRLVTMNCLNSEYDGQISDVIGLEGTPLSCRPAHIERLIEALDAAPTTARDDAYQLLYLIDQVRILRGSLRQRMTRLPEATAEHRDFIADQRATLRQIDADLEQRRNRYSSSGWREVQRIVDEHRQRLVELDERIDEIRAAYPEWPARLDVAVSAIYFRLAKMRNSE